MKIFKFLLFLGITFALIILLDNSHKIGSNNIPPLGKFLDPFHGFWQNADREPLQFSEDHILPGIQSEITVVYDSNYVPHIYAQNNEDLFYAQGYIMAQNRLWQMEFQVMAAAGRLGEILGENEQIQDFDRLQRRKGMVYGAEKSAERMLQDPELTKYLEAYGNGVNAFISQIDEHNLPFEYKLLNYKPERWNILKTALILESMVDDLTGFDNDLENTNALAIFGAETFNLLFPERVPNIDPTVPTDLPWEFESMELPEGDENYSLLKSYNVVAKPDPDNGSNNWAISPQKSATGNALLASDPHLGLNLPSLWMMLHLNSPDYNAYGFSFPGALGITIGFNDSISWAFTNAPRDTRDWYAIDYKDESKKEYRYDSGYRPTKKISEEIKIKGKASIFDTIIYTHHGPIVYDKNFTGSGTDLSLKWGGHEGSMVQKAILLLNQGNDYNDYHEAIQYWDQPPQNAVFASVQGDIAMTIAGNYPLKWKGQGKFILEGNNPRHDWQGYIPKNQNAFQLNPERGFVSSANQHSVDENYPYWFYSSKNEYYRNRRINRILAEMDSITVQDMMSLQNDNYSIKAEEILPMLLDTVNTAALNEKELEIINNLKQWDYNYNATSTTPIFFEEWWRETRELLWDEFDRKEVLSKPNDYVTIHLIKNEKIPSFIDIQKTEHKEDLQELVSISFKQALENINEWSENSEREMNWGNYKNTSINHLARLAPLSKSNIPVSGHADAVNSTKGNHGPSFRMVVEMSSPPKAWGIYPGGQSGNPGSPAYANMIDEWAEGKYRELYFPSTLEEAKKLFEKTQILTPEKE